MRQPLSLPCQPILIVRILIQNIVPSSSFCAVTLMKVSVGPVNLTWLAGNTAVDVTIPSGITLNTNDLAGDFYRKVTSIQIPTISLKVLVTNVTRPRSWLEAAHAILDVNVDIYSAPAGWRDTSRVQKEFVRIQDVPTGRAKLMKESLYNDCKPLVLHVTLVLITLSGRGSHKNGLYLPQPRLSRITEGRAREQLRWPRPDDNYVKDTTQLRGRTSRASDSDGEEGVSEADRDARLA